MHSDAVQWLADTIEGFGFGIFYFFIELYSIRGLLDLSR